MTPGDSMQQHRFRAAGYLLARPAVRAPHMDTHVVPALITSLCACLTDVGFGYWWTKEAALEAIDFGVPESELDRLVEWYTARFGDTIGAPGVLFSVDTVRHFVAEFVTDPGDLAILGAGLENGHAVELLERWSAPDGFGEYGIYEMLSRDTAMESTGEDLGFEIACYEYGLEHSWLCNGLETIANERFGVELNQYGLIDSFDDASTIAAVINDGGIGAEPGLWLPWLIRRFPLESPTGA